MKSRKVALASLLITVGCSHSAPPPPATATKTSAAQPAPSYAPLGTPPKLRLPTTLRPIKYDVTMRMSPKEEGIKGRVDIELAGEPSAVVWIHAGDNLNVTSATAGGLVAKIERVSDDMVGLAFTNALPSHTTLSLQYEGKLPSKDGRGAYRQEEKGDWYIFTQFESTDARRAFPCFDEPSFKTPYTLTLEVPEDQLAFANTPEVATKKGDAGWKTVSFAPSQPLPSYLVAFAVGPFEVVDGGKAGKKQTPVRIIVPKGRSADAKYAAAQTGLVLAKLEDYFDMPYPFEKLDHIAVPQKGGAMENPGLITYGTTTILSNGDARSIRLERGYLSIAAHELGHIWTGDYVTTAWWDDIWLNEAFATWLSAKIVDSMHPEWDGAVSRVTSKNGVMGNDSLASARRIRQPIADKHDILNAFDGITYQKGGAVIAMMESWVGVESFRKAVQGYMHKHAYGNATSQEFLADMAAGMDDEHKAAFASTFSSFLDQPGTPLVKAKLDCPKDGAPTLSLTQQRFVPTGSKSEAAQTWQIPVCASFPDGKSCTLLKDPSGSLPLATKTCPTWVNPNAGSFGYYRGFLDAKNENALLQNKKLAPAERLAVFGDEMALVHTGELGDDKVLAQLGFVMQDGDRHLVGMGAGYAGSLDQNLVSDALYPKYRNFIRTTFLAKAKALGWTPKAGEDDGTKLLRPTVVSLAAEMDETGLAAEAKKLSEAWIADHKAVERDLVVPVLIAGMRFGDKALWDKFHDAAKKTNDRQDRSALLEAMSRARDPKIAEANLQLALSDELDHRDSIGLVFGVAAQPKHRQMAWDFVKANYEKLVAPLPWRSGAQLASVAGHFCDDAHRTDAEAFFADKAAKWPGGPRIIAQAMEGVSLCSAEKPAREKNVATFLGKY